MNKAGMNFLMHVLCGHIYSLLFSKFLELELLSSGWIYLVLAETARFLVYKVVILFYISNV